MADMERSQRSISGSHSTPTDKTALPTAEPKSRKEGPANYANRAESFDRSNPQSWGPRNTRNTRNRSIRRRSPNHPNQGPANYANRAESFGRIRSSIIGVPRNTRNTRSRPTSLPSPEHSNQGPANYSNRAESFDRIQSAILEAHGTHGTHGVGQRASQAPSIQIKGPRITRIEPNASIPSSSGCCRFPGPLVPTIRAHSRNSRAPLAFFRVFRVFRGRSPGIGF